MGNEPIHVLLADDHVMVRSGLALLIRSQKDMKVVGEAERGSEALQLAEELMPDVVVLDISMPGGSGIQVIEKLRAVAPGCRVLVLTMHDDFAYLRAAVAAGTSGYVVKAAADKELLSAIRTLHEGRTYVSVSLSSSDPGGAEALMASGPAQASGPSELSRREQQVLEFVAYGYTSQQVADRLGLSTKTIAGYRARFSDKLGLKDRADLVRYALEKGILDRKKPLPQLPQPPGERKPAGEGNKPPGEGNKTGS